MKLARIAGVAGILVLAAACGPETSGSAAGRAEDPATAAASAPTAAAPAAGSDSSGSSSDGAGGSGSGGGDAAAAPTGPASKFDDGQWSVPDEVVPGTYRSAGPEGDSGLCYADTTPAAGGNIDQQEVSNGGPVRIRVKKGQVVKSQGCQTFTKVA